MKLNVSIRIEVKADTSTAYTPLFEVEDRWFFGLLPFTYDLVMIRRKNNNLDLIESNCLLSPHLSFSSEAACKIAINEAIENREKRIASQTVISTTVEPIQLS